jgi:hypothetical protein
MGKADSNVYMCQLVQFLDLARVLFLLVLGYSERRPTCCLPPPHEMFMFDTRTSSPGETVLRAVLISIRACTSTAFSPLRDCWCSELLVDIEDGQFTRPLQAVQHCADEQSVSFSQDRAMLLQNCYCLETIRVLRIVSSLIPIFFYSS